MELVDQINTKKKISNEYLLTQIWSFIQGYALLIKNGATKYNAHLVDTTLSEFMKEE